MLPFPLQVPVVRVLLPVVMTVVPTMAVIVGVAVSLRKQAQWTHALPAVILPADIGAIAAVTAASGSPPGARHGRAAAGSGAVGAGARRP